MQNIASFGRHTAVNVARWILGFVFLASTMGSAAASSHTPGSVVIGSLEVPNSVLKRLLESVIALLLLVPRPSRSTGVCFLLTAAGLLVIRVAVPAGQCSCLDVLGGSPALVWGTWTLLLVLGAACFLHPWRSSWRSVAEVFFGVATFVTAVQIATQPAQDSPLLDCRFVLKHHSDGEDLGEFRITNRSRSSVEQLRLLPRCECIEMGARPETVPPLRTVMVPVVVRAHPDTVRPGVEVIGMTDEQSVRQTVWWPDSR